MRPSRQQPNYGWLWAILAGAVIGIVSVAYAFWEQRGESAAAATRPATHLEACEYLARELVADGYDVEVRGNHPRWVMAGNGWDMPKKSTPHGTIAWKLSPGDGDRGGFLTISIEAKRYDERMLDAVAKEWQRTAAVLSKEDMAKSRTMIYDAKQQFLKPKRFGAVMVDDEADGIAYSFRTAGMEDKDRCGFMLTAERK